MPLVADRFLFNKINKEAVEEQSADAEKIKKEIQKIYSKKEDITPTETMNERDYSFFLKRANDFGFSLFDFLKVFEDIGDANFVNDVNRVNTISHIEATAGELSNAYGLGHIWVNAGEVVKLKIADTTGTGNGTVYNWNIILERVGN